MKKIFPLLIAFIGLMSCSDRDGLNKKERQFLNKMVDSMYHIDQEKRIIHERLMANYSMSRRPEARMKGSVKFPGIKPFTYETYQEYSKKNRALMKQNDSLNARLLLDLSKKYGFLNRNRLKSDLNKAHIILAHAPKVFFVEIQVLIKKEYMEGRITKEERAFLMWHLHGRKGEKPKLEHTEGPGWMSA